MFQNFVDDLPLQLLPSTYPSTGWVVGDDLSIDTYFSSLAPFPDNSAFGCYVSNSRAAVVVSYDFEVYGDIGIGGSVFIECLTGFGVLSSGDMVSSSSLARCPVIPSSVEFLSDGVYRVHARGKLVLPEVSESLDSRFVLFGVGGFTSTDSAAFVVRAHTESIQHFNPLK